MPMTIEERKEYYRLYRIKHKDKINQQNRLWYLNNKEQKKEYRQTEQCKKTMRIGKWKSRGIICFDFNLLNDIFVKTIHCEFCNCELTIDKNTTSTTRCLDHDHSITDKFNIRGVLCHSCNTKDVLKITT